MTYNLGVDLGTTSIAAAVHEEPGVRMTALGDRAVTEPAVAYLRGDGTLITGRHASSRTVSSPGRVARGLLRHLGVPDPVHLGGQPFTVPDLLAKMVRAVLDRVTETQGAPPDQIVLSHPASWSPVQRSLFEQVAVRAGVARPVLVTAPQAAAAYYAASGLPGHRRPVAVYDLGGGTFDAAAARSDRHGSRILGAPEGDQCLGGIDIDEELMRYVDHRCGGELSTLNPREPGTLAAVARLRQDCTRAKELLSVESEVLVPVIVSERHFEVPVTRSELEDLVRARIEATVESLTRTLGSAGMRPDDLGAVLLLGGVSRMPLVTSMVSEALGRRVGVDDQLAYAVALGAAALAGPPGNGSPLTAPPAARPARAATPTPAATTVGVPAANGVPAAATAPADPTPADPAPADPTPTDPAPADPTPADTADPESTPTDPSPRSRPAVRPWALITAGVILLVSLVAAGALLLRPEPSAGTSMSLTTATVRFGNSYYITAAGFDPGEPVRLSWAGPTNGVMDTESADANGGRRHGPVIERDRPGRYRIIATGLRSGRVASVGLEVIPAR